MALPRWEDERLVTGKGRFTDDQNFDSLVSADFVRSPYAHAKTRHGVIP